MFKEARGKKHLPYGETRIDFSSETKQTREWTETFKLLKGKKKKKHQPRILCLVKLPFQSEEQRTCSQTDPLPHGLCPL